MNKLISVALLCIGILSGCASAPPGIQSLDSEATAKGGNGSPNEFDQHRDNKNQIKEENRVRPGFLYEVSNINDPGLNGKYRVDFDGKLTLAYGVSIDTTGMSESDLKAKVIESFKPFLKSAESTHVNLSQKKLWIDVRGLVNKAGRYLIDPSASIDEALNLAGSLMANSQAEYLKIQSNNNVVIINLNDYFNNGNINELPRWQGGEILFVQRKSDIATSLLDNAHPMIQVFGEVKSPGEFPFRRDSDFLYYITKAGGPSAVANLSKIEVVRWENNKRVSQTYDWDQSRDLTQLESGDLIIVHAIKQTPVERAIQSGAGVAAMLSAIGILIIAL